MQHSRVWTDVDFNRKGKQIGNLFLPYQTNRSADGNICTPVCVIKNGNGPTLLLTAGVHGDEYEGQIALRRLIQSISPTDIDGRIIILPSLNVSAARAGTRLSPLDDMNLHGAFPGSAASTNPTSELAFYIESTIVPMASCLIDLHSGGTSLIFNPFCSIRLTGNKDMDEQAVQLLKVFSAPLSVVWRLKNGRMLSSAAERNNVVALGGEFGGGAAFSAKGLHIIESGIKRVMVHMGIIRAPQKLNTLKTRFVEAGGKNSYLHANSTGLFEPAVALGQRVQKGQICGRIYSIDRPGAKPVVYRFKKDGFVFCMRHPVLTEAGDGLVRVASAVKAAKISL